MLPTAWLMLSARTSTLSGAAPSRTSTKTLIIRSDTDSGCILPGMSEKRSSEKAESKRLENLYRKAGDPVLRTHLLMVWRMSVGDSVGEVAEMVGYSKKWVREIKRRYESEGIEGLGDRRHSNPGAKVSMIIEKCRLLSSKNVGL